MIEVLLVDDEPMILDILKKTIPWNQYHMRVTGCCHNGEQALEMLKTRRVPLVFTDIKMPHMDGLELIRRVHGFLPDIHFIALSSYSDFALVKESFQYGVTDYILKIDLDDATVMDPLLKRLERMCGELGEAGRQEAGAADWLREAGLRTGRRWFRCLQIQLEKCERILWVSELLFSLQKTGCPLVFQRDGEEVAALVHGNSEEELREACDTVTEASIGGGPPCQIYIGMSEIREGGLRPDLQRQAKQALRRRFYHPEEQVVVYEPADPALYEEAVRFCWEAVQTGQVFSYAEIQRQVVQIFLRAEECFVQKNKVCDDFVRIFQRIQTALPCERTHFSVQWKDRAYRCERFIELFDIGRTQLAELYMDAATECGVLLDNAILAFIETHYSQVNLMIQDIAQYFGVSARKISNSIYKTTGLYFKQYLNAVRIEKARNLLLTTDLKVVAIAEMVGYLSVEHFSRSFAQATGVSPSAYSKTQTEHSADGGG